MGANTEPASTHTKRLCPLLSMSFISFSFGFHSTVSGRLPFSKILKSRKRKVLSGKKTKVLPNRYIAYQSNLVLFEEWSLFALSLLDATSAITWRSIADAYERNEGSEI